MDLAAAGTAAGSTHPTPPRVALKGSLVPSQERSRPAGQVAANAAVSFDLLLALPNAPGAQTFVRAVSSPGSAQFHRYLTDAQWEARYAPTKAEVSKASAWLRSEGLTVGAVAKDRLFVSASGTAAKAEKAFGVTLGEYTVDGHTVRLANGSLSIPSSLNGVVSGAVGVNQYVEQTSLALQGSTPAAKPAQEPAPPAGFRNPQPCSAYWGQKTDTKDSGSLYAPYTHPLPYDICGYVPSQLRGAYGLAGRVASGNNGRGVGLAIVDAYDSPTLLADAQKYFKLNDPANPLKSSQFINVPPATVDDRAVLLRRHRRQLRRLRADFAELPGLQPVHHGVGGTTLEVNKAKNRAAEYGWSTARQTLCTPVKTTNCGSATTPAGALAWQAGGGGGTSYYYTQPYYQAGIVPAALALRNEALFGPVPLRVVPDISMDADAQSGMLIGLTQTFPNGVYYDQFKEGGTSLASPLLAGVIADTDQAAGMSLGFLNPEIYKASTEAKGAFNDILPPANPDSAAVIRVDYVNSVDNSAGYTVSLRAINYAGPETYCDATGNCATRNVTLTTAPGYDGLTGLGSVGPKFISVLSKF